MVLPARGLTRGGVGCFQGEVTLRRKERIRPTLMIPPATPTPPARTLAQNTPQTPSDPTVHGRERRVAAMLKVAEPAVQRPVEVRNNAGQGSPVRPPRLRPERGLELVQALLPGPVRQASP